MSAPSQKERRCLVSGVVQPVERMIRFVVGPDGQVVPDIEAKLPGKGLWVTADAALIAKAVAKNRFKPAGGTAPPDLAEKTAALLRARVLSLIGLARKSGDALVGFDVLDRTAKSREEILLLIEASDGAADGKRKMRARLKTAQVSEAFDRAALSQAVGKENATHLGLKRSRLAEKIKLEMTRLDGLEGRIIKEPEARASETEAPR